MSEQQITDQGDLRHWRTELPNIIDDLGLTPYERTLYAHYKKVCGASGGTCREAVRTTARKTKMSLGKVSETRQELTKKGLIAEHEQPKKPDEIKPRVHVTIIDIWHLNFFYYAVMREYPTILPDIYEWTIQQLQEWVNSVHLVNGRSSGERGNGSLRSPGEQKKEHDSKKEPEEESEPPPENEPLDPLALFGIKGHGSARGSPVATDAHQRAVDRASGDGRPTNVDNTISAIALHHYQGFTGEPEPALPSAKAKEWINTAARLLERLPDDLKTNERLICEGIDFWWYDRPDGDFWCDKPHNDGALDLVARYVVKRARESSPKTPTLRPKRPKFLEQFA